MRFIYIVLMLLLCSGTLLMDFIYTCVKKLMNMLICPLKTILRRFKGGSR